MPVLEIIGGAVLLVCCLLVILFVTIQTEKGDGLAGAIMGGEGSAFRGGARSNDEKLASVTKVLAVVFFLLALLVNIFVLIGH